MRQRHYIFSVLCLMLLGVAMPESAVAQYYPERRMVREGNELFNARNFRRSLNSYNNALDHDSTKYEALYNRANAYYQATANKPEGDETYDFKTSNAYYEQIAADTLLTDAQRAEVLRNLGESLFAQQQYEAALNSFRESLRLNPKDQETKYNYVLTKRVVDQKRAAQNQNQNQNQNHNQDQNQDQNQNQDGGGENNQNNENSDQNQNKDNGGDDNNQGDNQQDNKNGDQNQDQQNKDGEDDQQQGGGDDKRDGKDDQQQGNPQPKELSPEKERMLDAIQAQEDKTQEKLGEGKKAVVIPGKKNW